MPRPALKKVGQGAEIVLQTVSDSADAFGPLKSVASGGLSILRLAKTFKRNQKDWAALGNDVAKGIVAVERHCVAARRPERKTTLDSDLADLTHALAEVEQEIKTLEQRPKLARFLAINDDRDEIGGMKEKINRAFHDFELQSLTAMRRDAERRREDELVNGIPSVGAAYDGNLHQGLRMCLSGTRTQLLQTVHDWIGSTSMSRMLCLTGLAGTGKSTVAYSIASHYDAFSIASHHDTLPRQESTHRLGASYFFSSGSTAASDGSQFFSTLASQLARRDAAVRGAIVANPEAVRDAYSSNFRVQYETLIRLPLSFVRCSEPRYLLIVVDSLDLCAADVRESILSLLIDLAQQISFVKILLTTRNDFKTRGTLLNASRTGVAIIHDMPHDVSDSDIKHFLSSSLIVNGDGLDPPWQPSDLHVNDLATRSAGLFIFAAVAVRYIVGAEWDEPSARLRLLLDATNPRDLNADDMSNPYAILDKLYHQVFSSIPAAAIPTLVVALQFLCTSLHPLALHSMEHLLRHTLRNGGSISRTLTTVEALLSVPTDDGLIALIHPSLVDYLTTPERCLDHRILVRPAEAHDMLARACMAIMREELHRSVSVEHGQSTTLSTLGYACSFWASHLQAATTCGIAAFVEDVRFFCRQQLLSWLEWMAATSELPRALESLRIASLWCQDEHRNLHMQAEAELLVDARRMLLAFWEPLSEDPQQIYRSALPFLPRSSCIRRHYSDEGQPVKILHGLTETWDACDRTIATHGAEITSVAFSDDGKRLASASRDGTVKVWDPVNGSCQAIIAAHTGPCANVQFLPGGKSLLSAGGEGDTMIVIHDLDSKDELCKIREETRAIVTAVSYRCGDGHFVASATVEGEIKLWNTHSLQCVATLRGHSDAITSLAVFSAAETTLLFSCSDDKSVRVWNLASRESTCVRTLDSSCLSLALSRTGCLLACGTESSGLTLWEVKELYLQKKWTSTTEYAVVSLCFICDSEHLVVGCESTPLIRILLSRTGETVNTFLSGHIYGVHSLAYSECAELLVSASSDQTLCIYGTKDLLSGREEASFSSRRPRCLVFSTSGALVSVGYEDGTISLRALQAGGEITCIGHRAGITALVFFSDNTHLLSSSEDFEIRAWDASSGACMRIFKAHTGEVTCLSASQSHFVSGSHDRTVKMWELQNDQVAHSFDGHTGSIHAVATHSAYAASASGDHTVRLWRLDKRRSGRVLLGHSHAVAAVEFSGDGNFVAAGSDSGDVIVWEGKNGDIIFEAKVDAYSSIAADIRMHMVCFVRNDSAIVAILEDGRAGIFDLRFGGRRAPDPSAPDRIFGSESFDFAWIVDLLASERSRRLLWIPNRHRCDSYFMASHANIISIVSKHGHLLIARFEDLP